MDAAAYLAELGGIVKSYNADVERAKGDSGVFDDIGELQTVKRAQADAIKSLRALKQRVGQTETEIQASFQEASGRVSSLYGWDRAGPPFPVPPWPPRTAES